MKDALSAASQEPTSRTPVETTYNLQWKEQHLKSFSDQNCQLTMKTKFERQRSHRAQFAPQSATIFKQWISFTDNLSPPKDCWSLHWIEYHCSWSGSSASSPDISFLPLNLFLFSSTALRFPSWRFFFPPHWSQPQGFATQRFTSLSQVISEKGIINS